MQPFHERLSRSIGRAVVCCTATSMICA